MTAEGAGLATERLLLLGGWKRGSMLMLVTWCIFSKRIERFDMLCEVSSPLTEATYSGLKASLRLMEKYSYLEVPGC